MTLIQTRDQENPNLSQSYIELEENESMQNGVTLPYGTNKNRDEGHPPEVK